MRLIVACPPDGQVFCPDDCCPAERCCPNNECCPESCEGCISHGELDDSEAEVTVSPEVVCVGESITFTASGVIDNGGVKRVFCTAKEDDPPVEVSYEWRITRPDGTIVPPLEQEPGSGPVATIVTDQPGNYTCTFTAKADRACPPTDITLTPPTAVAIGFDQLRLVGFNSDHDLMFDNNSDYEPTGEPYGSPEWSPGAEPPRNAPISHTMDQNVDATVVAWTLPQSYPATMFHIIGTSPEAGFNFDAEATFTGTPNIINLTSTDKIAKKIDKLTHSIEWTFRRDGFVCHQAASGPHTVYVTMGTPRDWGWPEHRVTQKRMERAIDWAGQADSIKPHEIVHQIMKDMAPLFYLDQSAPEGEAWRVPDIAGGVDCQSMARFAEKVAKMVNIPGTFQHSNIYAIGTDPTNAIEDDPNCFPPPCACCGLNSNPRWHPSNPEEWLLTAR